MGQVRADGGQVILTGVTVRLETREGMPVDQLDKMLLFAASIDQAVGERGLYASMMGGDFPFVFHRVGKNIQWMMKNTRFIAASGTPAARFTANTMPVE